MTKKYILFDLDGTLTNSSEGITKCVQHALNRLGIKENDQAMLRRFIGPPLDESFEKFYGFDKETALKAVDYYRERYSDTGIYENVLFDGIDKLLADLKNDGYIVALATCKPEIYVPRILQHFNIDGYFDVAVGSELEGGERRHKNQVINEVFVRLSEAGLTGDDDITMAKSKAIMIGDRKDDILGAKASGIDSMGVRYGFAEEQELEIAGADYIVETVEDIRGKLKTLSLFQRLINNIREENTMKKFIQEFKEFALKGNVMNLAVGVIIGAAFQSIVTALTSSFINPLIAVVTGGTNGEGVTVGGTFTIRGVVFDYGSFITAVINFLIMAFVLFLLVKAMNKMMSLGKKKEEPAPTTKDCPYCFSKISVKATRCPFCTTELVDKK